MINSENVDKISPSVAIQKLADVEIDATKSTSQKRKIADVSDDSSATETGLTVKKYREKTETDDTNGILDAKRPVEQKPAPENKTDTKPVTTRKEY